MIPHARNIIDSVLGQSIHLMVSKQVKVMLLIHQNEMTECDLHITTRLKSSTQSGLNVLNTGIVL